MFYREIVPSDELRNFILSFWEFVVPTDAPPSLVYEIFPDGCVSVVYIRDLTRNRHIVGVTGLNDVTVAKTLFAGTTFWGMRLSPAACSALLGIDPSTLLRLNKPPDATDFPHLTEGLAGDLELASDLESAVSVYESRMREIVEAGCLWDPMVANAIRLITDLSADTRVDVIARELSIGIRQLQRRFKASSGLTPKQFIRIRRIRETAIDVIENSEQNWAMRAAELGFADQSHLTHEFVSITNRSPRSFAETLHEINHGNLVD